MLLLNEPFWNPSQKNGSSMSRLQSSDRLFYRASPKAFYGLSSWVVIGTETKEIRIVIKIWVKPFLIVCLYEKNQRILRQHVPNYIKRYTFQ